MIAKLRWYYNRLKLMDFEEVIFYRLPQALQSKIFGRVQARQTPKPLKADSNFEIIRYSVDSLEKLFEVSPISTRYNFFNVEVDILKIKDWRKDFHNEISSPIKYYGSLNRQDFKKNGDVKIVSELSRLHFLPFLSLKYLESKEDEYLNGIQATLTTWNAQNPYLKSINWTSGIEVAIRSVNLIYSHMALKQADKFPDKLEKELLSLLSFNYQFLKNHLSLYSSANNHLTAELMGLVAISTYCVFGQKERNKWKTLLFREVMSQVNKDGVHMELSTRYHAEVTDQLLIALHFLSGIGIQIPAEIENRHKKMFEFIEHVTYHDIETVFGDSDEGYVIEPYFVNNFSLYKSQLASSNHLYESSYNSSNTIDFRNYLIFGESFHVSEKKSALVDTFFKSSGYCFMYDHMHGIKLSFDVGEMGDNVSSAHGHSDMLHFTLQQHGLAFIIDPGTYQYHSRESFWRDYFRGITAHNTISINGQHHAVMNNRMSWIAKPKAPEATVSFSSKKSTCSGKHTAFLNQGVIHQRVVTLNRKEGQVVILDSLEKENDEEVIASIFFHVHPDAQMGHDGNSIKIKHLDAELELKNNEFCNAKIFDGDDQVPMGWFSPKYNLKQKTKTICINLEVVKSIELETYISYC
nr:alginate lyase family protein [uncultured Allomuricauda sp.]